jgi:hypothetical protein
MLMIYIALGLGWCAEVANTGIRYVFAGTDAYEQVENVQAFVETLQTNSAEVIQFFKADGVTPEVLEQQLFGDTTGLMCNGETVEFADSLMDNLEQVGEILFELLVG